MAVIQKAPETMTSRARVLRTFQFEKTDRVPIGYDANPGIHSRLAKALSVSPDNMEAVYEALGVDCRGIQAALSRPCLIPGCRGQACGSS